MLYIATLVIDMDEGAVDFLGPLCKKHNQLTGAQLTPDDIKTWDLKEYGIENETWQTPGFFENLPAAKGAIEVLYKHRKRYRLTIATDPCGVDFVRQEKQQWLERHLPFVDDVYFTDDKTYIPGDLILDDCPRHLESYPGIKVKMLRAYNRHTPADHTIKSWQEFDQLLR
jgi:5'(3')-deoxyribonucleotidase